MKWSRHIAHRLLLLLVYERVDQVCFSFLVIRKQLPRHLIVCNTSHKTRGEHRSNLLPFVLLPISEEIFYCMQMTHNCVLHPQMSANFSYL